MEPNENNLKPQPTGGLKLMTVFIAVLALHVVVIGGFTVWHLLYPSGTDADLTLDKTHKNKIVADSSIGDMPADATATDKAVTPATTASPTDNSTPATADATSTPSSPSTATDSSVTTPDTSTPATTPSTASTDTPSGPVTPAMTPATPVMAEDASATAANPPASTPVPAATPLTPAPSETHTTVATTPDLAPPADASAATADTSTPVVANGVSYTVKRGDSLARIARRHHITLGELRSANNLKSDRLHIAQVLMLPSRAPKTAPADADAEALATPAPATTATPSADADTTDATPAAAPATHTMASTATTHHTHKLAATHHLYTVVKGDTLTRIAKRYHTTTSALVAANGLSNAGRLSVGEKLHIPSHEARTAEDKPIEAEPHGATRAQLANNLP